MKFFMHIIDFVIHIIDHRFFEDINKMQEEKEKRLAKQASKQSSKQLPSVIEQEVSFGSDWSLGSGDDDDCCVGYIVV